MKNGFHTKASDEKADWRFSPAGPEIVLDISAPPHMGWIFLKAFLAGLFRPGTLGNDPQIQKKTIQLKNIQPDLRNISDYCRVCGFSPDAEGRIPISYFQTLFTGMLGKFVTDKTFPLNPLGLIHTFQSFELKRTVFSHETLDISCTLSGMTRTEKGIESQFTLKAKVNEQIVWKGVSIFLTKARIKKKPIKRRKDPVLLEKKETFFVPAGTGRRYAAVSRDYNPHHLYTVFAKLFGFKRAIVHGMWSLGRVLAGLDDTCDSHAPARVNAFFKLPVFMPATLVLGTAFTRQQETGQLQAGFQLLDEEDKRPHLIGEFIKMDQQ